MAIFTCPDGDSLLEVNHCHGPGRGHPCRPGEGMGKGGPLQSSILTSDIRRGLQKVTGPDGSTWWIPEGSSKKAWYQQHAYEGTTRRPRTAIKRERAPDLSIPAYREKKSRLRTSTRPYVRYELA